MPRGRVAAGYAFLCTGHWERFTTLREDYRNGETKWCAGKIALMRSVENVLEALKLVRNLVRFSTHETHEYLAHILILCLNDVAAECFVPLHTGAGVWRGRFNGRMATGRCLPGVTLRCPVAS